MPILLVANANADTDVEGYLSGLNARSSRRCTVYVRHNKGRHIYRSAAFPFLVCEIEGLNPGFTTSRWPEADKPAVFLHDSTAPEEEEIIVEHESTVESITYLQQMADLLEEFCNSSRNAQSNRRARSALLIVLRNR